MVLQLSITNEDISKGQPYHAYKCAIAKALIRLGYFSIVEVPKVTLLFNAKRYYFLLDEIGIQFTQDFDKGNSVKPCIIDLRFIY